MASEDRPSIHRRPETGRFELADGADRAYLEYREEDGRLVLVHTEVADDLEGEGVGSALVRRALSHAADEQLTVVPECAFVAGWLDRHPERAAELDIAAP